MLITKEITMNLNYRENTPVLDVIQGDSARAVVIHFMAGEEAWNIPEDVSIVMQYQCQDGTGGVYDSLPDGSAAYSVLGNALTVALAAQLCAVPGKTDLQVTMFRAGAQLSTFQMELRVEPQIHARAAGEDYTNLARWLEGMKGEPGYTPIKGTDYWTQKDRDDVVRDAIASLPVYDGDILRFLPLYEGEVR